MGVGLLIRYSGVPIKSKEDEFIQTVVQELPRGPVHSIQFGCGALILNEDRVLLLKRLRKPHAGCWSLPGGKVNPQEHPVAATRREVMEELGIDIVVDCFLCKEEEKDAMHQVKWLSDIYLVRNFTGIPENKEPDKHSDIGWFSIRELPESLTFYVIRAIEKWSQRDNL